MASFLGESFLAGSVGAALLIYSEDRLVPFGIGIGILSYAAAIGIFTLWGFFRSRFY
jgi:hypothetical protein